MLSAPMTLSHRAGKEPAPYYPSKSARGRGRGDRGPCGPHYPPMEGPRSFPDDVMHSMTQAIEHLERATYVVAAHGPPPPPPHRSYIRSYRRSPRLLRGHIRSTVSPTGPRIPMVIPMITDTLAPLRVERTLVVGTHHATTTATIDWAVIGHETLMTTATRPTILVGLTCYIHLRHRLDPTTRTIAPTTATTDTTRGTFRVTERTTPDERSLSDEQDLSHEVATTITVTSSMHPRMCAKIVTTIEGATRVLHFVISAATLGPITRMIRTGDARIIGLAY